MRHLLLFLLFSAVTLGLLFGRQQQPANEGCSFALEGESARPSITGPEDIVALVYAVEQPDSPIEILSADLQGMSLSVSNEQHAEKHSARYWIRNRSNRQVSLAIISLMVATRGSGGDSEAQTSNPLKPGETVEIQSYGFTARGDAPQNHVHLLLYVNRVEFADCAYRPSLRIPRGLDINFVW